MTVKMVMSKDLLKNDLTDNEYRFKIENGLLPAAKNTGSNKGGKRSIDL